MHSMRRGERQITDPEKIFEVIQQCQVCRLGFWDGQEVYIVPLNFGCVRGEKGLTLFFHSAREGRKVDLVRRGGTVAFEMDCGHELITSQEQACSFSMRFQSVIGQGLLRPVEGDERTTAFRALMAHYTPLDLPFGEEMLARTLLFAVEITELSCKERP